MLEDKTQESFLMALEPSFEFVLTVFLFQVCPAQRADDGGAGQHGGPHQYHRWPLSPAIQVRDENDA